MQKKGQGALEYLLIIGGAILVAAIVISLIMAAGTPTKCAAQESILDGLCAKFNSATCGNAADTIIADPDGTGLCIETDCSWTNNVCVGNKTSRSTNCFQC